MKKLILILSILFITDKCFCQSAYTLPLPEKWGSEKISFPISFAPKIPYKGNEELRFTPGWSDVNSDEYWSYSFLWFIEGTSKINSDILQNHFVEYFDGLFKTNNKTRPAGEDGFTKVQVKKVKTIGNDNESYEATISTLNFLTGKPIALFVRIHIRNYPNKEHSALLFELSPKPYNQQVWQKLDTIVNGFRY